MRLAAVRGPNGNKKTHENEDVCKQEGGWERGMRLREDALKAWEEDGDNHNNEMKEIGGKKLRCFKSEEENR